MRNCDVKKVAIIDYDMGNLFSVKQACNHVGLEAVITHDREYINNCDAAILPGVGAFGEAMGNLKSLNLVDSIKGIIDEGKPFFGICLGMQLLMSISFEFGEHCGLDIFKGRVVKFPLEVNNFKIKTPQVGWNKICSSKNSNAGWEHSLLKDLKEGAFMYFVHSFYVVPEDSSIVLSTSEYEGVVYCSSLTRKNIFACQFHPERSAQKGLTIYRNFANCILEKERT